jgi:hypothetical protein
MTEGRPADKTRPRTGPFEQPRTTTPALLPVSRVPSQLPALTCPPTGPPAFAPVPHALAKILALVVQPSTPFGRLRYEFPRASETDWVRCQIQPQSRQRNDQNFSCVSFEFEPASWCPTSPSRGVVPAVLHSTPWTHTIDPAIALLADERVRPIGPHRRTPGCGPAKRSLVSPMSVRVKTSLDAVVALGGTVVRSPTWTAVRPTCLDVDGF